MSAYLQMGHHHRNLVGEKDLDEFTGIILSPVNRSKSGFIEDIPNFRNKGDYDIVFDPQLYFPRSEMGKLYTHPYFPKDFKTADLSQLGWWDKLNSNIAEYSKSLGVDAVASPAFKPRKWDSEYYNLIIKISNNLKDHLDNDIRLLTSIFFDPSSIEETDILQLASIMSRAKSDGFYLIADIGKTPRREIDDDNTFNNYLKLIYELKNAFNNQILVSHTSADMVLLKSAGATNCATGKFFNLRRFTPSRYSESEGGGGQLPYWFEHSLFAFLREPDVLRLQKKGHEDLLKNGFSDNYWSDIILKHLKETPNEAWLRHSWRQYLSWFAKTEQHLSTNDPIPIVNDWLESSENNWVTLKQNKVLFDEIENKGDWVRKWRIALIDLEEYINSN